MITGATTRREPAKLTGIRQEPAKLTDDELQARVSGTEARCAGTAVPPDEWFPLAADPVKARRHAQRALALCGACSVRAECLELSLRQWSGAGHHGIWGGTLENERHALRRQWLAGINVGALLRAVHDDQRAARGKHLGTSEPCRDWGDG